MNIFLHIRKHWLPYSMALVVISVIVYNSVINTQDLTLGADEIQNESQREELQRYFGYELLLFRYLTLPYDVSINLNQRGAFVEIGFLYLMFIPILIFLVIGNQFWKKMLFFILALFLLIVSVSNSFLIDYDQSALMSSSEEINNYLSQSNFWSNPLLYVLAKIYLFLKLIYIPIEGFFVQFSDDRDFVTYPILFFSFLVFSYVFLPKLEKKSSQYRWLVVLLWLYGFFWFILSSGIIWYGYLLFALCIIVLFTNASSMISLKTSSEKNIAYAFFFMAGLWLLFGYVTRISNISINTPQEHRGKEIINPTIFKYAIGELKTERDVIQTLHPGLNVALDKINAQEQEKVYRIGTSFTYFIKNNHKRVVRDNQLGLFQAINSRYQDKITINDVFKASKIRFLIVDLNTPTIDNTPEKTLTQKYREFLQYVFNNPDLVLIATDRVVSRTSENGEINYFYNVFGNIVNNGSYAIYEIN